ncbi:di-trans,poly-cis-decaprenylcistransferase [Patescibacteria group bacterium]|nr:di-trans,poly-cis-decaprenylcistransferase [Patescibacteria group bacterium]MBU1931788.1 di-trans,poly-cis-decaprenylcistransferase [Patescibacteria group bacterium]
MGILPNHIAIIVDGNRRWTKKHNLPPLEGHQHVTDHVLEPLVFHCLKLGIPYLTFWAFSTENWQRGPKFYKPLFKLLTSVLNKGIKKYQQAGVGLNVIGDLSRVPSPLVQLIKKRVNQSPKNQKITVTIGLNYGGRDEIVRAVQRLRDLEIWKSRDLDITEKEFAKHLDSADMPDPDLIIRTGGSQRTSGFMPWQTAYAEWYFTNILMPDFTISEFQKALDEFAQRQRRFGK